LILLESNESFLHIEFQTLPKNNIPFRILDYRVRMYRKDPTKPMRQVVIYLKQTRSELAYQTSFMMERTRHEFDVIRLWEQPASLFLQYPGLIPFAVLGESVNAEETLRQVAQRVDQIADPTTKANLMAASGILAGLKLEDEIVYRILRRDIMQESTVYRSIERDARKEEKRAIPTERFAIALNLLRGGVALNLIVSSTGLSIEEVQQIQQQLNESAKN
jgi:predicted transposase/invertase (TIGR01784 family)